MNDAFLVSMLDGMANLDEQLKATGRIEMVLVAIVGDPDAANQFHHEVRPARLRRAGIQDARDIGVIHHRQRLSLGLKSSDDAARIHPELDHFERDAAANRLRLLSDIDDATATFAQFFTNLVVADDVPRLFGSRNRNHHRCARATASAWFEKFAGALVRTKQQFDAQPQFGVCAASLRKPGGTLVRRQRQRGLEDGFFGLVHLRKGVSASLRQRAGESRRRGKLSPQFLIGWEYRSTALPNRAGIVRPAGLLILISQPGVRLSEVRLGRLRFLLFDQGLKMLNDFVSFVEHRRPIGHPDCLREPRFPI